MDLEQIFEYAIEQEKQAQEFYELSAEQTENAEASVLFRSLAKMEIGHRRALENERNILMETGELKVARLKVPTEQEQMLASLKRAAQVLKETNVELTERQEKAATELEMAANIQRNLLPTRVPQLPDLEISVACFMAKQIGGDFYDYLFNPLGHLNIVIGDVSGKGVPAALLMVAARTLWRSKVRDGNTPERILDLLSQDVSAELSESDQYITMLTGSFDPSAGTFVFSNAGHWPPHHFSAKKRQFSPFPPGFLPIGMDIEATYSHQEARLESGDVFVLFSDGIIDARNAAGEFYGEERLMRLIEENYRQSAEFLRGEIFRSVNEFANGKRYDDQTLIVLKKL